MGDYNLTDLSSRNFEHMIQALGLAVISPGVTVFGDGPDGAREATYRGQMSYSTGSGSWDGYLIMQAKFRERPSGDVKNNGEWARAQLRQELEKFLDVRRSLPKPEYYVLATNVILTAVQDVGGKDRLFELFNEYAPKIGLKGFDVWDYDKLARYLDAHGDVRRRYLAYICPGDVLAAMMQDFGEDQRSFEHSLLLSLQQELRADQYAKLVHAGASADQKAVLGQVFVDLRATNSPIAESETPQTAPGEPIVAEILAASEQALRPSLFVGTAMATEPHARQRPEPGRFVIVGGPGQGKSTVAQYLCQQFRAAILSTLPHSRIGAEARDALRVFVEQGQGRPLPSARRFPVRIVLDKFATWLSENPTSSLLDYIASRIAMLARRECRPTPLRRWLEEYPWLLVLDGLDEVPATSNRRDLIERVSEFLAEAALLDADILVVATTRPQGYAEEFAPRAYQHRYLTPMVPAEAQEYASRLVSAQYPEDMERREEILGRLNRALTRPTTSRLMRSPLQVTIMAVLADGLGQPPDARWELFHEYYNTIYRRETERNVALSGVLQQRRADIDAIHGRVGLLLQAESETAGGTASLLTQDRFNSLVRARCAEEGFQGPELNQRTQQLTDAALQRLVFLVGAEENRRVCPAPS